jgi:protein SCO1/2
MTRSLMRLPVVLTAVAMLAASVLSVAPSQAQKIGSSGGSFDLIDQNGRPFSSTSLVGRPYAIFFGFTHCPDICPTTLVELGNHLSALGPDADRLKIVFVTVDAARDTPEHLRTYLASFDPRIIGLTGNEAQIAEAAKGWDAHYNAFAESDGSIIIVHSAHVYLMDADNRLAATLNFQEPETEQLAKLKTLLAGKPAN